MKALRIAGLLVVLSFLLSLGVATPVANADDPTSLLLPVNGSWKDMSSKWWQWVLSYPMNEVPLNRPDCSVGGSGSTLFLAGGLWTGSNFTCQVPGGKRLFLPVANLFVLPTAHPAETPAEIRSQAKAGINGVYDLRAAVDGVPVQNVQRYRLPEPSTFPVKVPADNVFAAFFSEYGDWPAGVYTGLASDGYYLWLAPMSPGPHTIHVHGVFPATPPDEPYVVDLTFNLTVLP